MRLKFSPILGIMTVIATSASGGLSLEEPPAGLMSQLDQQFKSGLEGIPPPLKSKLKLGIDQYENALNTDWKTTLRRVPDDFGPLARCHYTLQFLFGGRDSFDSNDLWVLFEPISDVSVFLPAGSDAMQSKIASAWFQLAGQLCTHHPEIVSRYAYDADVNALRYARQLNYSGMSVDELENVAFVLAFLNQHFSLQQPLSWRKQQSLDARDFSVKMDGGLPIESGHASDVASQEAFTLKTFYINALKISPQFRVLQYKYIENETNIVTQNLIGELKSNNQLAIDCLNLVESTMNKADLDRLVGNSSSNLLAPTKVDRLNGQKQALDSLSGCLIQRQAGDDTNLINHLKLLISLNQALHSISGSSADVEGNLNNNLTELWLVAFKTIGSK